MSDGKYTNQAQQRLLAIVMVLSGDVVTGYTPGQIAVTLNIAASHVTRDLDNLATAGWVTYSSNTGRWMLAGQVGKIGIKVMDSLSRAQQQLDEAKNRFTK